MNARPKTVLEILELTPVIPVVTIEDAADAVPLAQALVTGGLKVIEVTLRSAAAMAAIRAIAHEVPEAIVGAGTLTTPAEFATVSEAGARFAVSPGATPELLIAAARSGLPYLPGVATPSEAMAAAAAGYTALKFFPAESSGGPTTLKSLGEVFPKLRFFPTGGIGQETMGEYLKLENVVCVGGSWIAPREAIRACDWSGITARARTASETKAL